MVCKKCGGNLVLIEDTIAQCEDCKTKYRVRPRQPENVNTSENSAEKEKIEIDYSKPFSSHDQQTIIEKCINDALEDDLNRTKSEDIKSKIIINTIEPENQDFQNSQDVNDVLKEYDEDNYPESKPLQENIYCSKCNNMVDLKTGICPNCQNVMPLPEKQTIECPFCHYENNNIASEFCIKCGKDLDIERERLGIVLKMREHKKVPTQSKTKSKGDGSSDLEKSSSGKLICNFVTVLLMALQGYFLITKDFLNFENNTIAFNNILDIVRNTNTNLLTEILTKLNFGEEIVAFFTGNLLYIQILKISLLVLFVTMGAYIIGSLFKMLFKKSVMKSVVVLSIVNFIACIVLSGFMELLAYKLTSSIVIDTLSPIIALIISFVVMFMSFMIA